MKTALEEELGTTLAARASTLPPGVAARVRAIDYHPRQRRRALPIGLAAGAAGAATVGTVLAVALGGAAPAYAGWSATPTSSTPASSAPPDCLSSLANAPAGSGTSTGSGTWQSLLSDVRGPFTVTLLQNSTSYATCFTGPSFTEINRISAPSSGSGGLEQSGSLSVSSQSANGGASQATGGLGSRVSLEMTSSGDLNQILQNHLTTSADGPYTFIDGRVASGVSAVTLALTDGQDVASTVADGWFVAWWPGSTDATSAQVTKASATTSEPFVPISTQGVKLPLGQGNSASGVSVPPAPKPGTCTSTTGTTGTKGTGGPSVNCQSSTGSSGNSGTSNSGVTGGTGSGPTTSPKS